MHLRKMPLGIPLKILLLPFFNEYILRGPSGFWDLLPDACHMTRYARDWTEIWKYNTKAS